MIDARQLRIGNWVNYKGEAISVTMIGQYGIQSKTDDILINAKFSTPDISPIPLTPEILLACGFEKKRSDNMVTWRNGDVKLMKSVDHDKAYFLCGLIRESKTVLLVFYLHQLQNLYYALTQTELTFNPSNV